MLYIMQLQLSCDFVIPMGRDALLILRAKCVYYVTYRLRLRWKAGVRAGVINLDLGGSLVQTYRVTTLQHLDAYLH